jgi:isopenicillin-N epimerase
MAESPRVSRDTTELSQQAWGADLADIRAEWDLDQARDHLNHGSFGAVPRTVRRAQARWRDLSDANPMNFYRELRPPAIRVARQAATSFLGVEPDSLALVANATTGVSTVLASFPLRPGDEIVLTDHAYGAVTMAARRFATAAEARLVIAPVDLAASDEEVVNAIMSAMTDRTRLLVVDHVTSATARLFPVRMIAEAARDRGVATLVDGAHAPGMLPVRVDALGADFWVGNFHKWAFAARSVAGLWIAPDWQARVRPLVVSWNEEEKFPCAFDNQGTVDDSAWLALPDALDFFARLQPERLREHNNALAAYGQQTVAAALGTDLTGVGGDPSVSMRLAPLPASIAGSQDAAQALSERIARELNAEVAITKWRDRGFVRLSAQLYNSADQYDRFAAGLAGLLR